MTARNWATSRLQVFTNIYNHFTNILPLVILANEYFDGTIEYGVIAQARGAFWHILDDFSLIIVSPLLLLILTSALILNSAIKHLRTPRMSSTAFHTSSRVLTVYSSS